MAITKCSVSGPDTLGVGESGTWKVKGDGIHPDKIGVWTTTTNKKGKVKKDLCVVETAWKTGSVSYAFLAPGTYIVRGAECCPFFLFFGLHVVVSNWAEMVVTVLDVPVCGPSAS